MSNDEKHAIVFEGVTKRYRLGGSAREQILDVFGLTRFMRRRSEQREFLALDDVSFQLGRGRRMGLIGRNGAGKTTLLKLISGNFRPSAGRVEVGGSVQALMTMGQGFHPDYTGRENISASLYYNGLSNAEVSEAFEDVVEFCELGPFLEQPFRTYSSGMQSRLMFATATAIRPDILVVDEVMGAGDAYFIAKSKQRIDRIISRGCTLLLVSHSMSQVLELCDEVIWLEGGRINMIGEAFRVVKAYEEALYGAIPGSGDPSATRRRLDRQGHLTIAPQALKPDISVTSSDGTLPSQVKETESLLAPDRQSRLTRLQLPVFMPHAGDAAIPAIVDAEGRSFHNTARDGLSRWGGVEGVKIVGFAISGPNGPTDRLISLQPGQMTIFLELEMEGAISFTYGVAIHDLQGRAMCRFFSQPDHFEGKIGDGRRVELLLNPNQIGPGVYTVGISIHEATTIEDVNAALRYDLLSRSFQITVELPDSLAPASAQFFHSCEWNFQAAALPAPVTSSKATA